MTYTASVSAPEERDGEDSEVRERLHDSFVAWSISIQRYSCFYSYYEAGTEKFSSNW